MIPVSVERHLELLRKETDRERRAQRKAFGFTALYGGDPNARVLLPPDFVEPCDLTGRLPSPPEPQFPAQRPRPGQAAVSVVETDFSQIEKRVMAWHKTLDKENKT